MVSSIGAENKETDIRQRILATARRLVAERTFDNVRMRDVAADSGVALNTLYRHFPNKTAVLNDAIVEFFRAVYDEIGSPPFDHGIDKVFHIIETVARLSNEHSDYAQALGPRLVSHYAVWTLGEIRFRTYLPAIEQIALEGDLVKGADATLLTTLICRQITALYASWSIGELAVKIIPDISKLMVSLTLQGVSTGYTRARCAETVSAGLTKHAGLVFY